MRLLWRAGSNPVAWWWAGLALVSSGNIVLWVLLYRHVQATGGLARSADMWLMLFFCAAYVFGCAFRSLLPRADVQRLCLFDTWLSSVVIGRSVATVAEVCFAAQWAMLLHKAGSMAGADGTVLVAAAIVPLIVVAQICSWYGVLTTNCLANAIENSIWAIVFFAVGIGFCRLLPEFEGVVRLALIVGLVGIAAYLAFLITVDVPMYLSRWQAGVAEGCRIFSPLEGFRDARTRRIVTHDLAHWREEIAWMSLYFSAAVWASLALCLVYSLGDDLIRYRAEPSVHVGWVSREAA